MYCNLGQTVSVLGTILLTCRDRPGSPCTKHAISPSWSSRTRHIAVQIVFLPKDKLHNAGQLCRFRRCMPMLSMSFPSSCSSLNRSHCLLASPSIAAWFKWFRDKNSTQSRGQSALVSNVADASSSMLFVRQSNSRLGMTAAVNTATASAPKPQEGKPRSQAEPKALVLGLP